MTLNDDGGDAEYADCWPAFCQMALLSRNLRISKPEALKAIDEADLHCQISGNFEISLDAAGTHIICSLCKCRLSREEVPG